MKGLKQFQKFDLEEFLKGKELTFLDSNPYYEYVEGKKTENILGVKLVCVITKDDTEYESLYEKLNEYNQLDSTVVVRLSSDSVAARDLMWLSSGVFQYSLFLYTKRDYTTLRIGGPAEVMVNIHSADEIAVALRAAKQADAPVTIIGNGSNLLVRDGGIRGDIFGCDHCPVSMTL